MERELIEKFTEPAAPPNPSRCEGAAAAANVKGLAMNWGEMG